MAGPLARLYATLGLDAREFDTGLGRAQKSISGFGRTADLAMASGAAAVAGGLLSTIGVAREWESSFAGVKKTLDTTGLTAEQEAAAFGKLEGELRDLAKTIPISANELAGLAEAGGALGVAREDITEFARVTALIGTTTDVVAQDAATALGKLGTVLGLTADDYERFGSTLVDLGNKGASTESEIVAVANRLAGTASVIGLSTQEMLGWSAALANVGIEAEAGGSSFQKFAFTIQEAAVMGGGKLDTLAEITGKTAQQFQALWSQDSNAALTSVIEAFGQMTEAEQIAYRKLLNFDDIRIATFMSKLSSNVDNVAGSLGVASKAWDENQAMVAEAARRFDTVDSKMQLFWNKITDLGITLGNTLLPPLTTVVEHVGNFISILGDAAKAFPAVTAVVTPLVTALAGLTALRFGARFLGLGVAFDLVAQQLPRLIAKMGAIITSSSLGQSFATAITSRFSSPAMLGPLARVGTLWGTVIGGAMAAAAAALVVVALLEAQKQFDNFTKQKEGLVNQRALISQGGLSLDDMKAERQRLLDEWERLVNLDTGMDPVSGAGKFLKLAFGKSEFAAQIRTLEEQIKAVEDGLRPPDADPSLASDWRQLLDPVGTAIEEETKALREGIAYDLPPIIDPDDIGQDFAAARQAIISGFGSIKSALKDPPQIIGREGRIENMEARMKKVMKNLHRAVKADDPYNVTYWQKAAAKQQAQIDKMKGTTTTSTAAMSRKFGEMGTKVKQTWNETRTKAKEASEGAKADATSAAQGTVASVSSIFGSANLFSDGIRLIGTWTQGLIAGKGAAMAAAAGIAAAVAAYFKTASPPKVGPLSTIDKDGEGLVGVWASGIKHGLGQARDAATAVAGAFSPAPALALAGGGGGGDIVHIHVGTLIADEGGIDELQRRMDRRLRRRSRGGGK